MTYSKCFAMKKHKSLSLYLSWYISGEVAVWCELEVAAISCPVVHHIDLPRLEGENISLNSSSSVGMSWLICC